MERVTNDFDRAKGRMASDFRTMIADGEDLLQAVATVSGESFTAARAKFEEKLKRAKASLADASRPMIDKTRKAAAATDDYVRGNPWSAVGVAAASGALIGFLIAKR